MYNKNENDSKKVRVTLNIPKEIDDYVRSEARRRGIAKTHMIVFALSWYRDYNRSMDMMPQLLNRLDDLYEEKNNINQN